MRWLMALVCVCLVATSVPAAPPALSSIPVKLEHRLPADLYHEAIELEEARELTRAEAIFAELIRRCQTENTWRMRRDAEQGLVRIADLRAEFSLSQDQLQERLAKTYRGYQASELADLERRGSILACQIDGKRLYSMSNPGNLQFFDTSLMARNESAAKNFRKFADIFLEESAKLDALRAAAKHPEHYVAPVRMVYAGKVVIRQSDLPPGKLVRAWLPYPLLAPAIQNIRTLSALPAGTLKSCPDIESQVGTAYFEVPRPDQGDVVIELKVAFDAYHSDFPVDPDRVEPYDTQNDLYRRFTRSEQQMTLTEPLGALAREIVGGETNPYRKARRLYDWVCDHLKYNFVWRWRDATFTYGSASEEVRKRRIGDCVIQSVFYAALCRSVGIPARVHNGPIFPPGMKNDHVWAEFYVAPYGWLPVDVTYSEVASMVPGLTEVQRRCLRDFFFARMDRWRFCTERNDLAQELVPRKCTPRRHVAMFTAPEFECGGQNVVKRTYTWECQPQTAEASR